ncbi:MAG: TAXI family TRAP transporter solute-binding subunit [Synergistaceae bacterium]|jgi:TRAP transporter TAXI family solute receptor|nr:TAXI family TRAP transporter solute-binding subunit [Synergistaceae bacterium]
MVRKNSIKAFVIALFVIAFTVAASGSAFAAAKTFLSIATGGTSGTYYPIGGAIAQAVSKGTDIQATPETSNASVANVNLVATKEIEVAFVQNDITFWAYTGDVMFQSPLPNLRAIAALYPEHVQVITAKDSKIATIDDLKGKRVGVGAPGSGVEGDVRAVLKVAGLKYSDMRTDFLDFGATTSRFKDNQIDAGFVVAGFPTASVMDLSTTKDISLIDFTPEFMDKLTKEFPYFIKSTIPANTYRGVDKDVTTPAVMAILITHDEIPEDVIYEFTKAMFANIADIHAAHAKGKEITLKTALDGLTVPLHPGAAKFYKEQGMKVD